MQGLFQAPAALPIWEVVSPSIEPSAGTIELICVNDDTKLTSSPRMFIGVVIAEEGEIIMTVVLVQLIGIPTLVASLLRMRSTEHRYSEEVENSAMALASDNVDYVFYCENIVALSL